MYLEIIIGVVVAILLGATIAMEIKNRNKKSDFFTNIIISVIGFGSSAYMLYSIFSSSKDGNGVFSASLFFGELATWVYIFVALLAVAFTVIFIYFHMKNKDLVEEVEEDEEETEENEDENLTDEEIEEILEKENNEETQSVEENEKEEINSEENKSEIDEIVLESLTAQKPKVLKPDEEDFKYKEGATQVPTTQRNPFEKK